MTHQLPPLGYDYTALEPYIDEQTMRLHHTKHHQTYVDKLNAALEKHPEFTEKPVAELLKNLDTVPEDIRPAVRNHGGGHLNHSMFWKSLKKDVQPSQKMLDAINTSFGSFDNFKGEFTTKATGLFGSGWVWLISDNGKLSIATTPNQDTPVSQGKNVILGLDVWEHAYYKKFGPARAEYISAWWNVINWDEVEKQL